MGCPEEQSGDCGVPSTDSLGKQVFFLLKKFLDAHDDVVLFKV